MIGKHFYYHGLILWLLVFAAATFANDPSENTCDAGTLTVISSDPACVELKADDSLSPGINTPLPRMAAPPVPMTISPGRLEEVPANQPILLTFSQVASAAFYHVARYDRTIPQWSYSNAQVGQSFCSAGQCQISVPGIPAQDRALWRVRSFGNGQWSAWSTAIPFVVVEPSAPVAPTPVSPAAGDELPANTPIEVTFTQVPSADRYHVARYDRTIPQWSFNNTNVGQDACSGGLCQLEVPGVPEQARALWRVRAFGNGQWSEWSASIAFDVFDDGPGIVVAAGGDSSCAIVDANLSCWGELASVAIPAISDPLTLAVGDRHACAANGVDIVCWGLSGTSAQTTPPPLINPTAVSAGDAHSCAIDTGDVVCWGDIDTASQPLFNDPVAISSGQGSTCAIDASGVVCWGEQNTHGELDVPILQNPQQISAGRNHYCALDDIGVTCWGANDGGQSTVPSLSQPTNVGAGGSHSCAIDSSGLVCWGSDSFGQLNAYDLAAPVAVVAGDNHTCAADETGILCWGDDSSGQSSIPSAFGIHWPVLNTPITTVPNSSECMADLGPLHTMPGIVGAGTATNAAGRGGDTCKVTTLYDSGPGSLRHCVTTGIVPRTVIFDVGGRIELNSTLQITRPDISIIGQTAAGDGIELYRSSTLNSEKIIEVPSNADRTLIQHLSLIGDPVFDPIAYSGQGGDNDTTDHTLAHVTVVGSIDELGEVWRTAKRITIANNLFAEPRRSAESFSHHGFFFDSSSGVASSDITYAYNVSLNGVGRFPYISDYTNFVVSNNVVHDSGNWATQIRNFQGGVMSGSVQNNLYQFVNGGIGGDIEVAGASSLYIAGNSTERVVGAYTPLLEPPSLPSMPLLSAGRLITEVVPFAGHSLPARGQSDSRRVNDVVNNIDRELLNTTSQVPRPAVLDNPLVSNIWMDGVPAAWKERCGVIGDANATIFPNGYSALENWIYGGMRAAGDLHTTRPLGAGSRLLRDGVWELVSIPAALTDQVPVRDLVAEGLTPANYGTTWTIFQYRTEQQRYEQLSLHSRLLSGRGYWMLQNSGSDVELRAPLPDFGSVSLVSALAEGWNLSGSPLAGTVSFGALPLSNTAANCLECSLSEALNTGVLFSPPFIFNSSSNAYESLTDGSLLSPWSGYWLGAELGSTVVTYPIGGE